MKIAFQITVIVLVIGFVMTFGWLTAQFVNHEQHQTNEILKQDSIIQRDYIIIDSLTYKLDEKNNSKLPDRQRELNKVGKVAPTDIKGAK